MPVAAGVALIVAGCGGDSSGSSDVATTSTAPPAPSTGGGHLLFSRFDESTHTFLSTHVVAADGTGEVELTMPGTEGGGHWSHAGTEIAVSTSLDDGRIGTAILSQDGAVERILTIDDPSLNLPCVFWSPDDSRLACEGWDDGDPSRTGIYTVASADGTDRIRLTTPPADLADRPGDFTPDGTRLLFKRAHEEDAGNLFFVDAAAPSEPEPFGTDPVEDPGRISPDGTLVATSVGGHLVILGMDGSVRNTVEDAGHYLFGPSWSPDGDWVAYSSALDGPHSDIYISHPDGTDRHQITDTPDNEIVVEWGRS